MTLSQLRTPVVSQLRRSCQISVAVLCSAFALGNNLVLSSNSYGDELATRNAFGTRKPSSAKPHSPPNLAITIRNIATMET
jgi:hypothetical protein